MKLSAVYDELIPYFIAFALLLFLNSGISMMLIFSKFPLNNRNIKEIIKEIIELKAQIYIGLHITLVV